MQYLTIEKLENGNWGVRTLPPSEKDKGRQLWTLVRVEG